ncbi:hypothetical protein ACWIG5_02245 [Streptomyces lydicus]
MTAADCYTTHVAQGFSHVRRQEPQLVRLRFPVAEYLSYVLHEFACHLQLRCLGVVSQARQMAAAVLGAQIARLAIRA